MKHLLTIGMFFFLVMTVSCSGEKDSNPEVSEISQALTEAILKNEILNLNDQFNEAAAKKDLGMLLALYDSTEMYWLPPNSGKSMGMKSVRDNYNFITSTKEAGLWYVVDQIFVNTSGNLGSMMGSYHFRLVGNKLNGDDGKFFLMLEKRNGTWKVKSDIYNSDFSDSEEKELVDKPTVYIHTYKSDPPGSVNSHLILTPSGITLIDALRTTGEARKLAEVIQAFNRPLSAIFITHSHPDHFGGLEFPASEFPSIPIYSSKETREAIVRDKNGYIASTKRILGSDFGSNVPIPTSLLDSVLVIQGIEFHIGKLQNGEAEYISTLYIKDSDILFSSDLINNQMIPYLAEGNTSNWLRQLDYYSNKFKPTTLVYPGHGKHGSINELINIQREYILTVRNLVSSNLGVNSSLSPESKSKIIEDLNKRYQGFDGVSPTNDLNEINVTAVATELSLQLEGSRLN